MADYQDLLFSRAFLVVPGLQYNEVSQRLRESQNLFFYEVILPPDTPWEFMRDRVFPSLARFLRNKSLDPKMGSGIVVSLFCQEKFFLLEGPEFMKAYDPKGLSENELITFGPTQRTLSQFIETGWKLLEQFQL